MTVVALATAVVVVRTPAADPPAKPGITWKGTAPSPVPTPPPPSGTPTAPVADRWQASRPPTSPPRPDVLPPGGVVPVELPAVTIPGLNPLPVPGPAVAPMPRPVIDLAPRPREVPPPVSVAPMPRQSAPPPGVAPMPREARVPPPAAEPEPESVLLDLPRGLSGPPIVGALPTNPPTIAAPPGPAVPVPGVIGLPQGVPVRTQLAPPPVQNSLPLVGHGANPVVGEPNREVAPQPREVPKPEPEPESIPLPPPKSESPPPAPGPAPKLLPKSTAPSGKVDPEQLLTLLGAARNAARQGDFELAITRYEQYVRLAPDELKVLEELAGVYFQADKLDQAVATYEALIRANRNLPAERQDEVQVGRYLLVLADIAVRGQDYQKAIGRLFEAMAVTGNDKASGARGVRLDAAARLAQVYLIEDQYSKACDVFAKHFTGLRVDDPDAPPRLVTLLLDLEQARQALRYLPALAERYPEATELFAAQVRAYAMLGDRVKTAQAFEVYQAKAPREVDGRLSLADQLAGIDEFDAACTVLGQAAAIRPGSVPVQLALARIHVRTFRLTQARIALDGVKPVGPRQEREWMLTRAEYHLAAGEWSQARLLLDNLLRKDPFDAEARLALGNVFSAMRELEKAKAEYCKVPGTSRLWRPARRGFALALAAQRRFPQAVDALEDLLREAPWDPQTVATYMRVLGRAGMAGKALEVGTGYLQTCPPLPSAEATVRAAFGRALIDAGKPLDADQQFAAALAASRQKSPLAVYGQTRLGHMFGDPLRFPPKDLADQPVDELRYRLLLSDFYADDRDDGHALEFAVAALRIDPHNPAALARVADAQVRIARQTLQIDDAVHAAKAVLACSPTNNRGLFALARAFSIGKAYPAAVGAYQRLVSLDPEASLPKRELARVYYADHQYEAAHDTYLSTGSPDPASAFRQTLQTIATRVPQGKMALEGLALGRLPPDELRAEVNKLSANVGDPQLAAGLQAAASDYEARVIEARGAELEARAKDLNGLRPLSAIGAYKELNAAELDNTEGRFDLGQIYSGRRMTRDAVQQYGDLLSVDPQHREGMIASQRAQLEMAPAIQSFVRLEHERGRNELANMDRSFAGLLFTTPLGDENEYLGVGYTRIQLTPTQGRGLSGNMPSLIVQKRTPYFDQTVFRGVLNVEAYANRVTTKPTFDAGLTTYGDGWRCGWAGYLENVTANGTALDQNIYRYGLRLEGEYQWDRRLNVGGLARYAHYSDNNDMAEVSATAAYLFTYAPRQLRFVLYTDNLFYREQTVFGPLNPFSLVGTIHPYFAPQGFNYNEARLDYTEWLSPDYFAHSNQCWYNLQAGVGFDSNASTYGVARAAFNWDVKPWLTVGADARYTYSNVYQFAGLYLYLVWRLPNCPRL